jgi:hypothetical protein
MPDHEKIPGQRRRRCNVCKCLRYDVTTQINPYDEDVRGERNIEAICDDCYKMLQDEI